jgi:hypothetical protein
MQQIAKRIKLRLTTFLLLTLVVAAGLFSILSPVAGAAVQNDNQARSRTSAHPRKRVHISCRQLCLSDYDACASPGAKRGIRSCKAVRNECLAECPTD